MPCRNRKSDLPKFSHVSDPISLRSFPEGKYLEVNDSFVNLLEYSRAEIIGKTADELGSWTASPQERQHLTQALEQSGKIQGLEIRLVSRSGKQIFSLASCELIELDGRRCLLTVAKDISDRKRIEESLQQQEAKLREAQQVARIGSWELEVATYKVLWSEENSGCWA